MNTPPTTPTLTYSPTLTLTLTPPLTTLPLPLPCPLSGRVGAAAMIVRHVSSGGDAGYAVKRLVRGMCSSRESARQGFASCLAQVLSVLPEDEVRAVPGQGSHCYATSGCWGRLQLPLIGLVLCGAAAIPACCWLSKRCLS